MDFLAWLCGQFQAGEQEHLSATFSGLFFIWKERPNGASAGAGLSQPSVQCLNRRLLNPNSPREVETICLKCLEVGPCCRFASAKNWPTDWDCSSEASRKENMNNYSAFTNRQWIHVENQSLDEEKRQRLGPCRLEAALFNQRAAASRYASPLDAGRQFGRALDAQPSSPKAVAGPVVMIVKRSAISILVAVAVSVLAAEPPRVELRALSSNTIVCFSVVKQEGLRFFYQESSDLYEWRWTGYSNPGFSDYCCYGVPSRPRPLFVRAIGVAAGANDTFAILPVNRESSEVVVFGAPLNADFVVESSLDGVSWQELGRSVTSGEYPPGVGRVVIPRALSEQVRVRFVLPSDYLNIAEAVFRDMMGCTNNCAYFLSLMGRDPDQHFLDRFAGYDPAVQPGSAFFSGRGLLLEVNWMRAVGELQVEVDAEWYVGPLAAEGLKYILKFENGAWIVTDRISLWVS